MHGMSGRTPLPRTRFTRVPCSEPGVTVFQISGSLGPRAKPQLVRLTQECLRRNLPRMVFDLSEVDALGGGTARLLNEFAAERAGRGGKTAFRVTSRTVRGFLCADHNLPPPPLCASLDEAIAAVRDPAGSRRDNAARPAQPARAATAARSGFVPPRRESTPAPEDAATERAVRSLFAPEDEDEPTAPDNGRKSAPAPARARRDGDATRADELPPRARRSEPSMLRRNLDLDPPAPKPPARRTPNSASVALRDRLMAGLRQRGVASRLFLFERDGDGRFYLVTRHGADRERGFEAEGGLGQALAGRVPTFLIDVDPEVLNETETELLGELNCEVASPLGSDANPQFLAFLSKEQPGDEYSLEELQELEDLLASVAPGGRKAAARTEADRDADARPRPGDRELQALFGDEPASAAHDGEPDAHDDNSGPHDELPSAAPPNEAFLIHELDRPAPVHVADAPPVAPARATTPEQVRALRRSVAQMRDILSLTQDFDAGFGTPKLLEVLVLSVVSVARVETVLYFAAQDGDYQLTHHRGLSGDSVQGLRLRGDSTLVQRALGTARGVEIGDSAQITEEERIWARQIGVRWAVPFRYKDETIGLLLLGDCAVEAPTDLEMLGWLLAQAGLAYDRARLYETLQDRTLGVVRGLITLIEARNAFDCGSTEQVVRYSQALARELQFPAEQMRDLVYGAVLRDVGMLKISEALLRSSADLTSDQWETIRQHPQEGAAIMRQMRFGAAALDIVLHHHETYNGEGYPMGLRGRAIPLGARIVAVAESYVKMTMDRPYRKALPKPEALESLAENWGLRYDPLVVDALVRVVNREMSLGLRNDRDLTKDLFGV
jgi:HD-GYP domain-containing protein (c-di-GMP phosphodiesterase class II)